MMNSMHKVTLDCALALAIAMSFASQAGAQQRQEANHVASTSAEPSIEQTIVIDKIWSAVSVGFCLLTHEDRQYIAYYNAGRRMVVGQRKLTEDKFTTFILPSESDQPPRRGKKTSTIQGWDSHNYITMAVDREGYLHLSGNMHVDRLLYFRSKKPGDVTTMVQVKSMVGDHEDKCTYPKFTTAPDGSLLYHYRDGWSGNGQEIYNRYDVKTRTWGRFLEKNLVSGQGKRNAYQLGPKRGPDDWYHLLWTWRETSQVETCNNISYARSPDMQHWFNAAGQPLKLPITRQSPGTIIDPVPVDGGLHNSHHRMSFDSKGRFIASYIKHDENDHTQIYIARFEQGQWKIRAVTNWQSKHLFKGGGSGPSTFGTSLWNGTPKPHGPGKLAIPFRHWKAGKGLLVIDEETFKPLGVEPMPEADAPFPLELTEVHSDFPGMGVKWAGDRGHCPDPTVRYVLRWECLGANRDRPREGELPTNSDLVLYRIKRSLQEHRQP